MGNVADEGRFQAKIVLGLSVATRAAVYPLPGVGQSLSIVEQLPLRTLLLVLISEEIRHVQRKLKVIVILTSLAKNIHVFILTHAALVGVRIVKKQPILKKQ